MRLGVFARLLIVLSIFWTLGGTLYFAAGFENRAHEVASLLYETCYHLNQVLPAPAVDCSTEREQVYEREVTVFGHPMVAGLLVSLAWLALALVVVIPAFYAFRWIVAGKSE